MGLDPTNAGQHDMMAVRFDADAAGGESAGKSAAALALEPGKPARGPFRLPCLESDQFFSARANASRPEL
jgi:hypothetical protein